MKKLFFVILGVFLFILVVRGTCPAQSVDPQLRISSPSAGATFFLLDPSINITVNVNRNAINFPFTLTVSFKDSSNNILFQRVINNPQAVTQIAMQMPRAVTLVGNYEFIAELSPMNRFTAYRQSVTVSSIKRRSELRITNPQSNPNTIFYTGEQLPVTVTMHQESVGVATALHVLLKKSFDDTLIEERIVQNPQTVNSVTFAVPRLTSSFYARVAASVDPRNFTSGDYTPGPEIRLAPPPSNLNFQSPQDLSIFTPGQTVPVVIAMNPRVSGIIQTLTVKLVKGGAVVSEGSVNNPGASTIVQVPIPRTVSYDDNLTLQYSVLPEGCVGLSAPNPVTLRIAKANTSLQIASPAENSPFATGDQIPVNVTLNQDAIPAVERVVVRLKRGNEVLSEQILAKPMASNTAKLTVPQTVNAGETLLLHAAAEPARNLYQYEAQKNIHIRVDKIDAAARITAPSSGQVFGSLKDVNITFKMNQAAVGRANTLRVIVKKGLAVICSQDISNPQADNAIKLPVVPGDTTGDLTIEAGVLPQNSFVNASSSVNIKIQKR